MRRRISSSALVGRDRELGMLADRLDAAARGVPSLTLVAGEAGVGKSRLVRRFMAQAREQGTLVLRGDCVPLGHGELPYAPIVAGLREILRGPSAPLLQRAPVEIRVELGRLLPELAGAPAAQTTASEFSQGRLYEQLLAVVRQLTREAPLLMVIEDLHWADPATRDLLAFCVRNLRDERLAVVATHRTDELDRRHPVRRLLAELIRRGGVTQLELGRLARGDVGRQIESILGRSAPRGLVDEIFARSDGNPFYVEELLAARDEEIPSSLADALLIRVDRLGDDALEIARVLAAVGRPVSGAIVASATGLLDREVSAALREATGGHVLVAQAEERTYAFRHALVRELVYADLLPDEKSALHRALAHALERHGAGEPAEIAFHWQAAGDARAALTASVSAGRAAAHVFAFEQALADFERALSLWDAAHPETIDRVEVLGAAADAARLTGDYDRAIALCREALARVDAAAEPARAAALHEQLGDAHFVDDRAALAAYRAALELLPERCGAARARVHGAEARVLTYLLRWEEARDRGELALRLAREAGARAEEGRARTTLGVALAFLGDPQPGEDHLRAALDIAGREGRPDDLARVHLSLAEVLRLRGRFGAALQVMLDGSEAAARLGMQGSFGRFMSVNAAEDMFRLGRWDEAASRLAAAAHLNLRLAAEVLQHAVAAQLAVARGDFAAARERLSRATAMCDAGVAAEYLPGVFAAAAELALWEGRPDEASADVTRGLEMIGAHEDPLNTPALYALGVRAHAEAGERAPVAAARSRRAAAEALVERVERLVARHSTRESPPEALAHLATCRAELGRLAGEPTPEAWVSAIVAWERLLEPYPAAYARWRHAEAVLSTDGAREQAVASLRRAHATARALGAVPLAAGVDALARAARVELAAASAPEPASAAASAPAGLSARELDVLALLAEGLTNRQIAQRLFISDRTVGVHVSNILGKLGARNRVMAAGIALRLGLVSRRP